MIWLLALVDVLAAAALLLAAFGYTVYPFQAATALLLILKAGVFHRSFLSIIDIAVGLLMFVLLWHGQPIVAAVAGGYLGVKAIYSFI